MRRLQYFLLLVLVVSVSVKCVSASTDCERWFAAYHKELMHNRQLQRIAAAKRRAKLYAKRKLAGYIKPAPKPKPALKTVVHHPMPRRQALRHLELACGVLPESVGDQPLIAEEIPVDFTPELPEDEIGLLPGFDGPGALLPEDELPAAPQTYAEAPPSGGGASVFVPPFTPPPGGGGGGNNSVPPPPPPPPAPVPEPGSLVFVLTGGVAVASTVRRLLKA